ncbi:hypothetical protein Tco_1420625 [Tanacetum coccineum]
MPLNQDSLIPPKHDDRGKGITIEEDSLKELIPLMDKRGSNYKMFEWIMTQAGKLGLPPPSELLAFRLTTAENKRKRASKILKEVFVKEVIRVDGMHKNMIPPQGVVGSRWLVITESEAGIFYYNRNFDLAFQRENELHLATTPQLIKLQNDIQGNTLEAEEIYKKLEFAIVAKNDAVEARIIVKDNLDDGGMYESL